MNVTTSTHLQCHIAA